MEAMEQHGTRTADQLTLPKRVQVKPGRPSEFMIQQLDSSRKALDESNKICRMIVCDLPE